VICASTKDRTLRSPILVAQSSSTPGWKPVGSSISVRWLNRCPRARQVERVEDGLLGGRHALPIPFCRTSRPHRASTFFAIAARDYTWRLLASASVGQ
jgi:hypothetical protein